MTSYLIIDLATGLSVHNIRRIRDRCVFKRVGLLAILFLLGNKNK